MPQIRKLLSKIGSAAVVLMLATHASPADTSQPSKASITAQGITRETCRPNNDPIGHALPLAAHWNVGLAPKGDTFDPQYQLRLIAEGHHFSRHHHHGAAAGRLLSRYGKHR